MSRHRGHEPGGRRLRRLNTRLFSIGIVMALAWVGIGYRLVVVQGLESEGYAARGLDQRLQREILAADRGTIFDRDGRELAVTVDSVTVYANPLEIEDPVTVARLLAPLVARDTLDVVDALASGGSFAYVARQLDREVAERVAAARLPGIYFLTEPKRVYPLAELTSQTIGFVRTDDNTGLEGLELQYDRLLSGTPGELLVERDPYGRTIPQGDYQVVPADPGSDLVLTIKTEIQFAAHRALEAAIERTGAEGGSVVVVDPATGEILAMVNLPTFDPNDRSEVPPEAMRNRAVTDVFEPGSTQKLVTIAGAIEDGVVTPDTVLGIPGSIEIHDTVFEDDMHHPGELSVIDIVAYSSNLGTIMVGEMMGAKTLHRNLFSFGFGRASGLDFPGEADGLLRPPEEWCATTCVASTAIGYRVSVTLLQMAMAYGTIANDGVWIEPHLVGEIVDGRGAREAVEPLQRQVVSAETAASMRLMLEAVVDRGTGSLAAVPGYRVGGKTGTTEKYLIDAEQYSEDDVVASFIGMAPIEDPQVVVAVMLDTPREDASGGRGAAPVFSEVMLATLHQLGVPPDGS
jgi:cell division protein FtsI (penicillin-binding protein 3)